MNIETGQREFITIKPKTDSQGSHYFSKRDMLLRRWRDLALIILCSPLLLFLFAVVGVAVFIDNGGGILFRQPRVGYKGKKFEIYKFRTMKGKNGNINVNTEEMENLTRTATFLRKHKLDEIPQFWNVIKGDMSLIGPRPEIIEQYDYYNDGISGYQERKMVPPGITGWAQVNYPSAASIAENREKLQFDLFYIRNNSMILDLKILIRTIHTIVRGKTTG